MSLTVNCPICQTQVNWSAEEKFKPFCSERCKLIDLGDWADEKHAIPVKTTIDPNLFSELDDIGYEEESFFKED
ncbi:DNA gyrase inhibitor YacG [Shewanella gaetbuli]|uniref:DNA gyrase inhibitor YacG n=1 Tax=Shewanella gaetbuli TaxID=220752 RepID=A0A9X1ZHY2_9GAMM|nr:DNA gyrase inhibitor YacG [Shewanella gaetbuli]MCL1142058.1 DNA gyrase inhibitor YacG [Shewanella gaetbuli]